MRISDLSSDVCSSDLMDYIYRSKQYDTPVNLAWVPSYSTVNLNFSLEKEGVRLGAFCNNMLNDRDASVGFNSRNINGEVVYQIQPREGRRCGVRANFSFRLRRPDRGRAGWLSTACPALPCQP